MENTLNFFGFFETPPFFKKLLCLSSRDWKEGDFFMNSEQYRKAKMIPLIGSHWKNKDEKYVNDLYKFFENEIILYNNLFVQKLKRGFFSRLFIVKLPCRCIIPTHLDNDNTDANSKRFIVSVMTYPEVFYDIGEESKQLPANEIWEINNTMKFGVRNYSHIENIHITADWTLEE